MQVVGVATEACQLLIEEGVPQATPKTPTEKGYVVRQASAAPISAEPGQVTLAASGRNWANQSVYWKDPIGIEVNSVSTELTFSYNGTCAYSGSVLGRFYWFGLSGWSRESWAVTQSRATNCSWWLGESRATYRNGIFCAGQTTWAYYDYVRTRGWNNGTATFARSTRVAGGCTGLLTLVYWYTVQPA